MLNDIQTKILYLLLESNGLFSNDIAMKTGLSSKSVRTHIGIIRDELAAHSLYFNSNTHYGYWIDEEDKKGIYAYLSSMKSTLFPETQYQRVLFIVLSLLKNNRLASAQKISETMHVSKATIIEDMKEVRLIVDLSKNLQLIAQKQGGYILQGKEQDIRRLFTVVCYLNYNNNRSFLKHAIEFFFCNQQITTFIHNCLIRQLRVSTLNLTDRSLTIFTYELVFQFYRIKNGNEIEFKRPKHEKLDFIPEIESFMNTSLSSSEYAYIYNLFKEQAKIQENNINENEEYNRNVKVITECLNLFKKKYSIGSPDLSALKQHLIYCVNYKDDYNQPAASAAFFQINDYPLAKKETRELTEHISQKTGYTFTEEQFHQLTSTMVTLLRSSLTKHRALLLTNVPFGYHTYMKDWLNTRIDLCEITEIKPLYEINSLTEQEYDLIISTNKNILSTTYKNTIEKLNIPIITISSNLDFADIEKLNKQIKHIFITDYPSIANS